MCRFDAVCMNVPGNDDWPRWVIPRRHRESVEFVGRTLRDTPGKSKLVEGPKFLGFLEEALDYLVRRDTVCLGTVTKHEPVSERGVRDRSYFAQIANRLSA